MNVNQNSARMKCYFHYEQNHFLDYFEDPGPDDAVIYMSDVLFQYNKREGRYTEFVGNPKVISLQVLNVLSRAVQASMHFAKLLWICLGVYQL